MPIQAQSADGVLHEFPDGTGQDVIDKAMKGYATQHSAPPQRGIVDKLFGLTGERYQTFPERAVRDVYGDVKNLMERSAETVGDPEATAELGPLGLKVAAETSTSVAPGAGEALGLGVDTALKTREIKAALPTTDAIKGSAQAAYKAVEDARLIASEGSLNGLISSTRAGLDQRLLTDTVAPRTFKSLEQLQKSGGDIAGILGVRQRLGEITPEAGADFAAAQHVRDAIDSYIEALPPSEIIQGDAQFTQAMLEHARASWRAYAELDQIETAMRIGQHRADVSGVGANTQNAMRQRIREILDSDKKSRGYSPEAKQQMEDIVEGTWLTNLARKMGKFALSGPVSALTSTTAALMGDISGGKGLATAAFLGVAIPATIAKYLGTYLTKQQIAELENIIRAESPLGRAAGSEVESRPPGLAASALTAGSPALIPGAASGLASQTQ